MNARTYLLPDWGMLTETGARAYLLPEYGIIAETVPVTANTGTPYLGSSVVLPIVRGIAKSLTMKIA